jgi:hypothetical protein
VHSGFELKQLLIGLLVKVRHATPARPRHASFVCACRRLRVQVRERGGDYRVLEVVDYQKIETATGTTAKLLTAGRASGCALSPRPARLLRVATPRRARRSLQVCAGVDGGTARLGRRGDRGAGGEHGEHDARLAGRARAR